MKKIGLFLTSGPSSGGTFQYSLAMLSAMRGLPSDEFSLVVAYIDPSWNKYLSARSVVQLPINPGRAAKMLAQFWIISGAPLELWRRCTAYFDPIVRAVVRQECDLWVFPGQDLWSSQFPVPMLAAVHDLMHRYESKIREALGHARYWYREAYLRFACRQAHGILVDSQFGKQHVHDSYGTPMEKLFVLPYVPPGYIYENVPVSDFNERYELPPKYLFYPARFWKHKNHGRLVRAVARVKMEFPDICLVLAGSRTNHYHEVLRLVETLGLQRNVFFPGYIPDSDVAEFYRRARALILPTLFGPTNIPPLEAFALGCPVAASRIYAMPEQVGDAALLFDPNSVEEMASCISQLWSDDGLCQHLISRGTQKAASWSQPQFNRAVCAIVRQLTNHSASK
jgi:glycosyltransferase involved in cell wall biosynthesis